MCYYPKCDFEEDNSQYFYTMIDTDISVANIVQCAYKIFCLNPISCEDYPLFFVQYVKTMDGFLHTYFIGCAGEEILNQACADGNAFPPEDCFAQYVFLINADGEFLPCPEDSIVPYFHNEVDGFITKEKAASISDAVMKIDPSVRLIYIQCVRNEDDSITTHYWVCEDWSAFNMAHSAGEFYPNDLCAAEYYFEK